MAFNDYASKIVLDPGSTFCKGGFSHEVNPRVVIPSMVEEQKLSFLPSCIRPKSTFHRPVENGIVTDWDRMEKLYTKPLYNDLDLGNGQIGNYPGMFVVENMGNTRRVREKTAELMFENFGVNSLCTYSAPLLSLLASQSAFKKQTYSGVVIELGYTNSFIVPVDNFTVYPGGWGEVDFGGQHITDHLSKLLSERSGYSCDNETAESAKISHARVRESVGSVPRIQNIQLKNGQMLGLERYQCTEQLFGYNFWLPLNIVKYTEKTCQFSSVKNKDLIKQKIMRKQNVHQNLCSNIVISGGTSVISGLCPRLRSELKYGLCSPLPICHCPVAEKYGAWQGAALMADMDAFRHLWIGHAEFEEAGVQIVHRKWPPVNTLI